MHLISAILKGLFLSSTVFLDIVIITVSIALNNQIVAYRRWKKKGQILYMTYDLHILEREMSHLHNTNNNSVAYDWDAKDKMCL